MRALILGTAGHIDHGKTELVRALTGTDTDRLPEEKRRGITIDIGFARLALEDGTEIGIVDVPGHEAFVRNMLAGATGVDLALLVIAADEGVMPQTREHLAILDLLGVHAAVVALTKIDLVDDAAWLDLVREDTRALLEDGPFADAAIIDVSARTGAGLDPLRAALHDAAARTHLRSTDDVFRMPVDRVFSVQGTGTVVTGTVWTGRVRREQMLVHLPGAHRFRVRGVQTHSRVQEQAGAGERTALALAGAPRETIARGHWLVTGSGWIESHMLTVRLRALHGPLRNRQRVRVHLGTAEVLARVAHLDTGHVPGDGWAQLRLESPVVARAGDRFVIRAWSPITTIGGGRIAEPAPPKRKRLDDPRRAALTAILDGEPTAAVSAAVSLAGWRGLREDALAVQTPLAPAAAAAALDRLMNDGAVVRAGATTIIAARFLEEATSRILERVRAWHVEQPLRPGLDIGELRACLPVRAPTELVDTALRILAERGAIDTERNLVRIAGFEPKLEPDQDEAAAAIVRLLDEAGLAPPTTAELPPTLRDRTDLDDLLHYLERAGTIERLAPGLHFAAHALRQAEETARHAFESESALGPGAFRELYGVTRKHLIPILEYLDRKGITVRDGDVRKPAEPSHLV